jgi:hypothetical protein
MPAFFMNDVEESLNRPLMTHPSWPIERFLQVNGWKRRTV